MSWSRCLKDKTSPNRDQVELHRVAKLWLLYEKVKLDENYGILEADRQFKTGIERASWNNLAISFHRSQKISVVTSLTFHRRFRACLIRKTQLSCHVTFETRQYITLYAFRWTMARHISQMPHSCQLVNCSAAYRLLQWLQQRRRHTTNGTYRYPTITLHTAGLCRTLCTIPYVSIAQIPIQRVNNWSVLK